MAQSGYTPILIYASGTTGNTPSASNLTSSASGSELALNYFDGKLFYKDASGNVQVLATKGGVGSSTNTQVLYNSSGLVVGSANMTFDGSTLTTLNSAYTGTLTGGTGIVNLGSGQFYKDASGNVGIGTSSPDSKLHVVGVTSGTGPASIRVGYGGGSTNYSDADTHYIRTGSGSVIQSLNGTVQAFSTSNTEAMRIDSSGNLLVGATSNPLSASVKGYVNGNFAAKCLFAGDGSGSGTGFFQANSWFVQPEGPNLIRSYMCGADTATYGQWVHYSAKSNGTPIAVFTASNGSFAVAGALSKGSGSFRIDHPLTELEETHQLVHSFIEGPQADLIYRGRVSLVNGKATVNIDEAATMTEGTFVVLCRDVQCFTTNESDWTPVRGSVSGNILTIESQDDKATSNISWMVIGERQDKHMMETNWTDESGKVIVEPLKNIETKGK